MNLIDHLMAVVNQNKFDWGQLSIAYALAVPLLCQCLSTTTTVAYYMSQMCNDFTYIIDWTLTHTHAHTRTHTHSHAHTRTHTRTHTHTHTHTHNWFGGTLVHGHWCVDTMVLYSHTQVRRHCQCQWQCVGTLVHTLITLAESFPHTEILTPQTFSFIPNTMCSVSYIMPI